MTGIGGNWVLGSGDVYKPDAWWVADPDRLDLHAVGNAGGPDLAVEVRSPSTWHLEIGPKRTLYEAAGVAERGWSTARRSRSWCPAGRRPRRPASTCRPEAGPGEVLTSPLLEGFTLAIDELFA